MNLYVVVRLLKSIILLVGPYTCGYNCIALSSHKFKPNKFLASLSGSWRFVLILIPSVPLVLQEIFVFPYLFKLLLGILTFVSSLLVESQAPLFHTKVW